MNRTNVHLSLDSFNITCSKDEIAEVFAGLLREMRAAIPYIRPEERAILRQIMSLASGTLRVSDLFPHFARESADHVALRRLRTAQFIIPAGRDIWELDQRIAIKPFARLIWDRLGEAVIFGEAAVVDLALPDVNESDETNTIRVENKKSAAWEDDDVLDFLSREGISEQMRKM